MYINAMKIIDIRFLYHGTIYRYLYNIILLQNQLKDECDIEN